MCCIVRSVKIETRKQERYIFHPSLIVQISDIVIEAERDGGESGVCRTGFRVSRTHGTLAITPADVSLLMPPEICSKNKNTGRPIEILDIGHPFSLARTQHECRGCAQYRDH